MLPISMSIQDPLGPWVDPDNEENAELDAEQDQTSGYRDEKGLDGRALPSLATASVAVDDRGEVEGHLAAARVQEARSTQVHYALLHRRLSTLQECHKGKLLREVRGKKVRKRQVCHGGGGNLTTL